MAEDFTTALTGSTAAPDSGCQCYSPVGFASGAAAGESANGGLQIPWFSIAIIIAAAIFSSGDGWN